MRLPLWLSRLLPSWRRNEDAIAERMEAFLSHEFREGDYVRLRSTFWHSGRITGLDGAEHVVVQWSDDQSANRLHVNQVQKLRYFHR